ncbi:MAG: hypothetical protein O2909_01450 [Chloroflexi bacterium]|nr:hypothetical protein [Chloroflexota bacterium]MDA1218096.1 hypothetical protein [Chloroflexota bacterium]PKB57906.1 MAG: hypothetical protein BZY73_00710 [SAR202 cluster bacterium Casp-Chloro-G3]
MPQFRFKACVKCGGDLAMDDGDWICLQCGTYYYVGLYQWPEVQHPGEDQHRRDDERTERATSILANRHGVTMGIVFASVLFASGSVIK